MNSKKTLPKILKKQTFAQSRIFTIETMELEFSNGVTRNYERLVSRHQGAVLVVPMLDNETILLIEEYGGGLENYHLSFPKGLIDPGETPVEAANRELQEEVGYGAKEIHLLKAMSNSPGYWNSMAYTLIAKDLYPAKLDGDEPEPLTVVPWQLKDYRALLKRDDFTEARSIAALLLVKEMYLNNDR